MRGAPFFDPPWQTPAQAACWTGVTRVLGLLPVTAVTMLCLALLPGPLPGGALHAPLLGVLLVSAAQAGFTFRAQAREERRRLGRLRGHAAAIHAALAHPRYRGLEYAEAQGVIRTPQGQRYRVSVGGDLLYLHVCYSVMEHGLLPGPGRAPLLSLNPTAPVPLEAQQEVGAVLGILLPTPPQPRLLN